MREDPVVMCSARRTPTGLPPAVYLASEWPWPSTSGGRVHAANLAGVLGSLFDLTVLAPQMPEASRGWDRADARAKERRNAPLIRARDFAVASVRGEHVVLERYRMAGLADAFAEELEVRRPELVVLGRPFFGPFRAAAADVGSFVVADADESLVRVARSVVRTPGRTTPRIRALAEIPALSRMERREYRAFDQVWVTSEADRLALSASGAGPRTRLVPNVVAAIPETCAPEGPIVAVGFVGWYGYGPNEAAALELIGRVMPVVHRLGGPRELVLIGRDPTPAMIRAARGLDWVQITGQVQDAGRALREAGLLVAPIRSGGGTRMKVLEAMALGVPVVGTPRAIDGFDLRDGWDVLVGDSVQEIAEQVTRIAGDPALRRSIADNARNLVRAKWTRVALESAVRSNLSVMPGRRAELAG